MKEYNSFEIQDISSNFRNVARRLSRTDYSQCDTNLKRFMSVLQSEELIAEFVNQNNLIAYDIEKILEDRGWHAPFEVSPVQSEEIAFSLQLLEYAIEHFDGDFTRLYGTHIYTNTKSTVEDEMRKFIEHIIDPLIDHISEYIHHCYTNAMRKEEAEKPTVLSGFSAQNSTVVIGSHVRGNVSNEISITQNEKEQANELIEVIREELEAKNIPNKEDIKDILQQVKVDVNADKKPPKGVLTALKVLCTTGSVAIPFVTALIELFTRI